MGDMVGRRLRRLRAVVLSASLGCGGVCVVAQSKEEDRDEDLRDAYPTGEATSWRRSRLIATSHIATLPSSVSRIAAGVAAVATTAAAAAASSSSGRHPNPGGNM